MSWLDDAWGSLFGSTSPGAVGSSVYGPPGSAAPSQLGGLLDPRGIREQAFYQGLGSLSQGLLAAGLPHPAAQGSLIPQALGAFQPAYSGALSQGYQQAAAEQQFNDRALFERQISGLPPAEQQIARTLGREGYARYITQQNQPYSLRPNEIRMGPNGPIAQAPSAPATPSVHGSGPDMVVFDPDAWRRGQGGGGGAPGTAPAAPPSPAPAVAAPPGGTQAPVGIRNNNWVSMTVPGTGGRQLQQYETPEVGVAAASQNLDRLFPSGTVTPRQLVQMWAQGPNYNAQTAAPNIRASVENYGTIVARAAGASNPDQPINLRDPATRQRVIEAMGQFETGGLPQGATAVVARGIDLASQPGARFTPVMPRQTAQAGGAAPAPVPAAPAGPARPSIPGVTPIGGGRSGLFSGNALDAQAYNTYRELEALRAAGQPLTRQQQFDYDLARRHLMTPRTTLNERGEQVTINPLELPTMGGGAPVVPPAAAPAAPGAAAPAAPAPAATPAPTATPARPAGPTVTVTPTRTREQPEPVARAMLANSANVSQVDAAIDALNAHPQAVGFFRGQIGRVPWVGNAAVDTQDPEGVPVRTAIGAISGLRVHDMSGAAVSASEDARLARYIPSPGDSADVVRTKLLQFRAAYQAIMRDNYEAYGPANREQNYQPLAPVERALQRRHANVTVEQIPNLPLASVREIAADAELWNSLSQEVRDAIARRANPNAPRRP